MNTNTWIAILALTAGPALAAAQATIPLHDLVVYYDAADQKLKGHFYVRGTGLTATPPATLQATTQSTFDPGGPWTGAIAWDDMGRREVGQSTRIQFETHDAVSPNLKVACFWMRGVSRGVTERSLTADNIEGNAAWYRERFSRRSAAVSMRMLAPYAALRPVAPARPASMFVDGVVPITLHRPLDTYEAYSVQAIWAWVSWGLSDPEVYRKNNNPNLGGGWALRVGQRFGNGFYNNEKIADVDPSDFVMFSVFGISYEPESGQTLELWSAVTREN